MRLEQKAIELREAYGLLPDPQERLQYLVEQSAAVPALAAEARTEANRVHGCVSRVWVTGVREDGAMRFETAADAPVVSGLAWLLADFYSGATPEEVVGFEPSFLKDLGLIRSLTENRQRGLVALRQRFRALAEASLAATSTED